MIENKVICPECGTECKRFHTPQEQEYPGAKVWPACTWYECPKCGWETDMEEEIDEGRIRENFRGW